ncbi:MAG: hypothetical protein KTR28_04695 [Micavibrio sp.]|nr:hypothetical protein [Micavibrio sp.]
MKREIISTATAFVLAFAIFTFNALLRVDENSAQASIFSNAASSDLGRPYGAGQRSRISNQISYTSNRILDLSGRDIYEVLDQPEMVRRDLPTVVWQYRSNECVLDIYFTASGDNVLAEPVVHYEIRPRNKTVSAQKIERSCVASLIKPRNNFNVLDAQAFYKSSL